MQKYEKKLSYSVPTTEIAIFHISVFFMWNRSL